MTEMDLQDAAIGDIADLAFHAAGPQEVELGKYYTIAVGGNLHQLDLTGDQHRAQPRRKTGTTTVRDAASFLAYWDKHADIDSEVYADAERLSVTAVLDANTQGSGARWEGHRLHLALRKTDTWNAWLANDGKLLKQEQFAEFLEDHLAELLDPAAAEMLEIAQSIQAATKVDFQSATRLATGQRQLQYVETTTAKAGQKGQLTIPETFVIGLVPFEGSAGYKLTARLRYRINDGLTMGYRLETPGDTLRTAFADVVKALAEPIDQPVMNGTPA